MTCNASDVGAIRRFATCAALAGLVTMAGSFARAAAYSDSFVADPASFSCGYYGTAEICGSYSLFTGPSQYNPRTLNAGDTVDESIMYTSPVYVPGSSSFDMAYVGLPDDTDIPGPSQPGSYGIYGGVGVSGYTGPANPIAYPYLYSNYITGGYVLSAGFCCGYGVPNPGFTITGDELIGNILTSDPNPIYGVSYGYGVVLPATPQLIQGIAGGTPGHPAILPTGLIGQISVDLSGQGSTAYYAFDWAGGMFQATGTVANANPNGSYLYQLEDLGGSVLTSATLDSTDAFSQLLTSCPTVFGCNLAPGEYIIGVTADSPFDPLLTLSFGTPVESTLGVPEPGSWMLLLGGIGMLGAASRSRRRLRQTV